MPDILEIEKFFRFVDIQTSLNVVTERRINKKRMKRKFASTYLVYVNTRYMCENI